MAQGSDSFSPGVRTVLDVEVAARLEACRLIIDDQLERGPCLPGLLLIKGLALVAFDVAWEADQAEAT